MFAQIFQEHPEEPIFKRFRKYKLNFVSNNSKFLEVESTILDFTGPSIHLLLHSIIEILHK